MELLQFKADWCGPCKQQSQILKDFDTIPVREIDIEEDQELANEYSVRSLPTLILKDKYKVYENFIGLTELQHIEDSIEEHV